VAWNDWRPAAALLRGLLALAACLAAPAMAAAPTGGQAPVARPAPLGPGERLIPIRTPLGPQRVWVRTVGSDAAPVKLLLLHGGPGATHEYFENFTAALAGDDVQLVFYDQLGSGRSDHPDGDALWTIPRFVDEVEQVRTALGMGRDDLCLLGHSWGGILAIEYALAHPQTLKCLVISNMMASGPAYNAYAERVLMPAMDPRQLATVKALEASGRTDDPRYMQILMPMHYEKHILRRPAADWPEPVTRAFGHINQHVYALMQGPSELGLSGRLAKWDRFADLGRIAVPTLVIAGRHDTMDPAHMARMAVALPHGELLYLPESAHMAMWDEPERYFAGLRAFLAAGAGNGTGGTGGGGATGDAPPASAPVALGQTIALGGPRVRPDRVVEDSRCPTGVRCFHPGRLVVRTTVSGGAWSRRVDLVLGRPSPVADGMVTLVSAAPDRVVGKPLDPRDYRFTFRFQGGL